MKTCNLHQGRAFLSTLLVLLLSVAGLTNQVSAQDVPEGAVGGLFSINNQGGKVYFSQGNLQYRASDTTWRFAENQYDFCGTSNNGISETYTGWIDLFGWGTSGQNHGAICYQPWSTATVTSNYKAYGNPNANLEDETGEADWGCNAIINGGNEPNLWRTLTQDEWNYVMNTRYTTSGLRFAKAIVNEVKGALLLPNNWDPETYTLNNCNNKKAPYTSNVISEEDWNILNAAGVVFLPAAGNRETTTTSGFSNPNSESASAGYWSTTHDGADNAFFVYLYKGGFSAAFRAPRYLGYSVRLAMSVETFTYNIQAEPNPAEGGTVSGAGAYDAGDICTLTAIANEGYTFLNWMQNGEVISEEETISFPVTDSAYYVANFGLNSYEIFATAEPEIGGIISGEMGTYNHFDTCTLIAIANEGYTFTNWTLDDEVVSVNAEYSFTVTGNATLVAHFELNTYSIQANANPLVGGSVSGAGTYEHGATVTLTATPNPAYGFLNWTRNNEVVSTEATYTFVATENASFVANFQLTSCIITVRANPNAGGTVSGGGIYENGDPCTVTAIPNEGYTFVKWTKNGVVVSTEPTYTFEVNGSAFYIANFSLDQGTTQTTNISTGWNWWSSFVDADDLLDQLETNLGSDGRKIQSQTQFTQYTPSVGMWVGLLQTINVGASYQIQTTAPAEINITGLAIDPASRPITLKSNWNWIGYPCTNTMSVDSAFSNLTPNNGDQVKSASSFTTYNSALHMWIGSLKNITPGMGLLYKNTGSQTSFTYPTGSRGGSAWNANLDENDNHWQADAHAYPNNMTVTAVVELDGVELAAEHYEIAAFANGECRGSAKLMYVEPLNRHMAFLTIHGEDAVELSFGLYDSQTGTERYDADNLVTYTNNATLGEPDEPYVVSFRGLTGVDEFDSNLHVFPNPVARGEAVNLGMASSNGNVQVEVINTMGAVISVETLTKVASIAAPSVPGVYMLRITAEGEGTYFRKLVVK